MCIIVLVRWNKKINRSRCNWVNVSVLFKSLFKTLYLINFNENKSDFLYALHPMKYIHLWIFMSIPLILFEKLAICKFLHNADDIDDDDADDDPVITIAWFFLWKGRTKNETNDFRNICNASHETLNF